MIKIISGKLLSGFRSDNLQYYSAASELNSCQ